MEEEAYFLHQKHTGLTKHYLADITRNRIDDVNPIYSGDIQNNTTDEFPSPSSMNSIQLLRSGGAPCQWGSVHPGKTLSKFTNELCQPGRFLHLAPQNRLTRPQCKNTVCCLPAVGQQTDPCSCNDPMQTRAHRVVYRYAQLQVRQKLLKQKEDELRRVCKEIQSIEEHTKKIHRATHSLKAQIAFLEERIKKEGAKKQTFTGPKGKKSVTLHIPEDQLGSLLQKLEKSNKGKDGKNKTKKSQIPCPPPASPLPEKTADSTVSMKQQKGAEKAMKQKSSGNCFKSDLNMLDCSCYTEHGGIPFNDGSNNSVPPMLLNELRFIKSAENNDDSMTTLMMERILKCKEIDSAQCKPAESTSNNVQINLDGSPGQLGSNARSRRPGFKNFSNASTDENSRETFSSPSCSD